MEFMKEEDFVKEESNRVNAKGVYSDFETHFMDAVGEWANNRYKGVEHITHENVVKAYWDEVHNIRV